MICPKCDSKDVYVSHTYSTGGGGASMQRRVCETCHAVLVTETVIVGVNPRRGQGAYSLAKRRAERTDEGLS